LPFEKLGVKSITYVITLHQPAAHSEKLGTTFPVHGYDSTRMYLLCICHLAQQNFEVLEVRGGKEGRGGERKGFFSHTKSPYFHIGESMQGLCVNKCQPLRFGFNFMLSNYCVEYETL
jgi:hypothetical protein